jgi:hypothetical protein
MKLLTKALGLCALCATFAIAQFSAAGDSVFTTPTHPTIKDSITYTFLDSDACCCAEFVNPSVFVSDTIVYLSFSVNTAPCQTCKCLVAGTRHSFAGGPLNTGKYGIYREQSFYCPPGTMCPLIAILPIRIGEVTVSSSTAAGEIEQFAPRKSGFVVSQGTDRTVALYYVLQRQSSVKTSVFSARGIRAGELYNGEFSPGMHRALWTAPAPGVYFLSTQIDGVEMAGQKIVVSR